MKISFLILIYAVMLVSCKETAKEYKVPNLNQQISEFINSKRCIEKPIEILVVSVEVRNNDTLAVEIADCYPNIKGPKFICDTIVHGYRVIFTGAKLKGYCQEGLQNNAFPEDILEINKKRTRLFEEFSSWLLLYKNGRLVYKDLGCAEDKL